MLNQNDENIILNLNKQPENDFDAQEKQVLEARMTRGANWFYWIAALSLINSTIYLFQGQLSFPVGLGITQLIDGISQAVAENSNSAVLIEVFAFSINAIIAGIFIAFGFFAGKRHTWSFVVGMILYTLDALLLVFLSIISGQFLILGVLFHALALYSLYNGLSAALRIGELEKNRV